LFGRTASCSIDHRVSVVCVGAGHPCRVLSRTAWHRRFRTASVLHLPCPWSVSARVSVCRLLALVPCVVPPCCVACQFGVHSAVTTHSASVCACTARACRPGADASGRGTNTSRARHNRPTQYRHSARTATFHTTTYRLRRRRADIHSRAYHACPPAPRPFPCTLRTQSHTHEHGTRPCGHSMDASCTSHRHGTPRAATPECAYLCGWIALRECVHDGQGTSKFYLNSSQKEPLMSASNIHSSTYRLITSSIHELC